MQFIRDIPRTVRRRFFLAVFAQFLLAALVLSPRATSQQAGAPPADQPEPPPPPAVFQSRIPAGQIAFLNDYDGKTPKEIMRDKRFRNLLKLATPRTTYHYGSDMSLSEASENLLDTEPLPIEVRGGRYVMIGSHGGSYLAGRTFIWFDMKDGLALGGVYFHPTNGEPSPTLTIFSKQLTDTSLSMSQLPLDFIEDLNQWALVARVPQISPRYLIPENGRKYVLVHDEDYCAHPPDAPAPPQDICQQMNADGADADMNAAYFMQETHNAANATAWMLEPDQIAWLGVRDRTCGIGLVCRIQFTRERTRRLIGPPGGVPRGRGR
jgi:hypothetical protein